jgi:F-type H+-transporting ATPase subunit b
MPQIAQLAEVWSSQVFWLLVIFGLVFLVVGRGMVPKVMDTVAMRDTQIANDLARAQAARDDADAEEEAWRQRENENRAKAQEVIAEAKSKAAASTERRLASAQKKIDETLSAAEERIGAARAEAAGEIEAVASEAAQQIVRNLAGLGVDAAEANAAVKEALANG